jgi:hypothetical protein
MSETYYFFGDQRMDTIIVDDSASVPFPIYFDIIFPFLECSIANVDVVGEDEFPIPVLFHDIRKHRINMQGQDLSAAQAKAVQKAVEAKSGSGTTQQGQEKATVTQVKDTLGKGYGAVQDDCMPCSEGFSFSSEQCCDCAAVREYARKRDELETYTTHPLCIREHSKELLAHMKDVSGLSSSEGCRIRGSIVVPRVKANLHFSAAINQIRAARVGAKPAIDELHNKFKVQHVIRELRFGEAFDGQATPLAGYELYNAGLLRHIYLIKLVPTRYEGSWIPIESYQYSFAPHTEKVDTSKPHWHLPGVYFRYEFTPMMALISTRYSHLSTYITRIFALVGGLWVVLGVIYRMSNKVVNQVNSKKTQ